MSDYDEPEPRLRRYSECPDRMCGAGDCPKCNPWNFLEGVYIGDIEEQEALKEEALAEKP
jgi:hypothetical protein